MGHEALKSPMNRPNAPTQSPNVFILCFGRSFHPDQIAPGDPQKKFQPFLCFTFKPPRDTHPIPFPSLFIRSSPEVSFPLVICPILCCLWALSTRPLKLRFRDCRSERLRPDKLPKPRPTSRRPATGRISFRAAFCCRASSGDIARHRELFFAL